jgi:hypothetical protein
LPSFTEAVARKSKTLASRRTGRNLRDA